MPISTSNSATAMALVEGGLSLTDVYTQMVQAQEELAEERQKNATHEANFEKISADIMVKIPIMERHKREYEEANGRIIEMAER